MPLFSFKYPIFAECVCWTHSGQICYKRLLGVSGLNIRPSPVWPGLALNSHFWSQTGQTVLVRAWSVITDQALIRQSWPRPDQLVLIRPQPGLSVQLIRYNWCMPASPFWLGPHLMLGNPDQGLACTLTFFQSGCSTFVRATIFCNWQHFIDSGRFRCN